MLVTLKEILKLAEEKEIAVGAFNTPNLESLRAVTEAAQELKCPVIIQFAQCHEELTPVSLMGPIMVKMAEAACVPICVHLDHGETLEYLEKALELGFTSVMYDGSALALEENIRNTKAAVDMAGKKGASVEAELGFMGKRESGTVSQGESGALEDVSKIYTDPAKAKEFVEKTHIDALACSFGTTHGIYLKAPKLNFSIVEAVRKETGNIPVVMHGGSGVGKEDFQKAIRAGVRKINYFTYMDKAGGAACAQYIQEQDKGCPVFFSEAARAAKNEMKENVKAAMKIFSGK